MPGKRYKPEEIVAKLRQVDVLVSQGQSIGDAIGQIGLSEVTVINSGKSSVGSGSGEAVEGSRA